MPEFYYASIEIIIFAKLLLIIILIRIALFINSNFYNYRNDFLNYCYNHKKPFFRSEKNTMRESWVYLILIINLK